MSDAPRPWIAYPHEPLEAVDENLWAVEGTFPPRPIIRRRMQIVRLSTGALLFHNAVPVDDATLARLRALGRPAYLVVPSVAHMLDAHPFREKLGLDVYCPAPVEHLVRRGVKVKGTWAELPRDPAVAVHSLDGVSSGEAVLEVTSPDGARRHLVFCDALVNLAHLPGAVGLLLRLGRMTGGPRVGAFFKWKAVKDKAALRAHLERLAQLDRLATLVPSHGAIVRGDVAGALREAARLL